MFKAKEFVDGVVPWIVRKVREAGASGVVLGLSGGIDSAVVAGLCVKALGADHVRVAWLPCESSQKDYDDAKLVADKLGLQLPTIRLVVPLGALECALEPFNISNTARGNVKSRLRMVTLYAIANTQNLLVAGTGDKSEDEVGYFTKYGDGGVDFLPIASILKTEVREVARYLDIPEGVITKPSSPGLVPDQTAEGDLGITYEQVDAVLSGDPNASKKAIEVVRRRQVSSAHKRAYPPIYQYLA